MYSFYNTKSKNQHENFKNLRSAIKLHDDVFVLAILRDNPELIKLRTKKEEKTIPMLAAEVGCSKDVFQTILEKSSEILDAQSKSGDTVESILIQNKREELLNQYHTFREARANFPTNI